MNRQRKQEYHTLHLWAKFVVWTIGIVLILLIFAIDVAAVRIALGLVLHTLYYFGVNTVAYLEECFKHKKHYHDKL